MFRLIPSIAKYSRNIYTVTSMSSQSDSQAGLAISAGRALVVSGTSAAPCAFSPQPSGRGARPALRDERLLPQRQGAQHRGGDVFWSLAFLLGTPADKVSFRHWSGRMWERRGEHLHQFLF